VKSMMHDLKEKGSFVSGRISMFFTFLVYIGSDYFVKHYVVLLGIPMPKLLLAFGINLVRISFYLPSSLSLNDSIVSRLAGTERSNNAIFSASSNVPRVGASISTALFLTLFVQRLRLRERLSQYSTIDHAVDLIRKSQRIIILTGAGISACDVSHILQKP
jgi:hypothetical protein